MNSLRHLSAFVAAAERASFAAAGESLGLTGSAVSKAVALLEAELGVPLLVRSTRGIALTPDGQMFHERCKQILAELEQAQQTLARSRGVTRGHLRVLMHPMPGRARVAAALPEFVRQYPGLDTELIFFEGYPGLEAVGADIALLLGAPELEGANSGPKANLIVLPLVHVPEVVCAAPAFIARCGIPRSPEDLLTMSCIAIRGGGGRVFSQWRFANSDRQCDIDITPLISYNDGPAVRAAAIAGHGIVKLPTIAVEGHLKAAELVRLLPDWYSASHDLNLVFTSGARSLPKVRAFIDFMKRLFADQPPASTPQPFGYETRTVPLHRWNPRETMSGNVIKRS